MEVKIFEDMSMDELIEQCKDFQKYIENDLEKKLRELRNKIYEKDQMIKDLETLVVVESFNGIRNSVVRIPNIGEPISLNELMVITRAYVNSLREAFQDKVRYSEGYRRLEREICNSEDTDRIEYDYIKGYFDGKIKQYSMELERREGKGGRYNKSKTKELDEILGKIM